MKTTREPNRPDSTGTDRELPVGPVPGPVTMVDARREPEVAGPPPGPVEGVPIRILDDGDWGGSDSGTGSRADAPPVVTWSRLDRGLLVTSATALLVLGLALLGSSVAAEFSRLHALSPLLGWGCLAALLAVTVSVGALAGRSWSRYRRLRDVTRLRQFVGRCQTSKEGRPDDDRRLRREFEDYLAVLEQHAAPRVREYVGLVRSQFNDYAHDAARDVRELETHLLDPLDRQADAVIETRAAQTAVATALASRSFDALIVFWQSVKLVDQVSRLYAGRPGVWGTLRLLRRGTAMVVFAEIAGLAAQALADAVAQKALGVLGGRAAEGTANGLLMLRLGEAVKQQCRPVPCHRSSTNSVRRLGQALASQGVNKPTPADSSAS